MGAGGQRYASDASLPGKKTITNFMGG